jgi:hypothetical protein
MAICSSLRPVAVRELASSPAVSTYLGAFFDTLVPKRHSACNTYNALFESLPSGMTAAFSIAFSVFGQLFFVFIVWVRKARTSYISSK